jgi:hypothetical protein
MKGSPGQRLRILVIALLCTAPVPGDIGACGSPPDELDPEGFFQAKKRVDCSRCRECDLTSNACERACDRDVDAPRSFPDRCEPVVHDGVVCLRKLLATSCDDYAAYVRDREPAAPSECNFCPLEGS